MTGVAMKKQSIVGGLLDFFVVVVHKSDTLFRIGVV